MSFDCSKCGACCKLLSIPCQGRIERAWLEARKIGIGKEKLFVVFPCQYLDQATNRCNIYLTRPISCKLFKIGGQDCRDCRAALGIKE